MKRKSIILSMLLFVFMFFVISTSTVNAKITEVITVPDGGMLAKNNLQLYANVTLDPNWFPCSGVSATGDEGGDWQQKAAGIYKMWRPTAGSASKIVGRYPKVGLYNDGKQTYEVGCVVSISGFKAGNGSVDMNSNAKVGLARDQIGFILEMGTGNPEGLIGDVEVYFYKSGDATMKPLDMGQASMGIGGFNSQKHMYDNGGTNTAIYGRQWEWVSFDSQSTSTKAYMTAQCRIRMYKAGETARDVADNDDQRREIWADWDGNGTMDQLIAQGNPYSYGYNGTQYAPESMKNPVGRNIFSNGGRRIKEILEPMAGGPNSETVDMAFVMFEIGRETSTSGLHSYFVTQPTGTFSVFKFEYGKDVGSVELGLYPVVVGNEMQPIHKEVNKAEVYEDEEITYTITQRMGNMYSQYGKIDTTGVYQDLEVIDQLPDEVEFVSATAYDENGKAFVASQCKTSVNGNKVTFEFQDSILNNTQNYRGQTYTFVIKVKAKNISYSTAQDFIATNRAYNRYNKNDNYRTFSDPVDTQVLYDIFTKGIKTTIAANKGDGSVLNASSIKKLKGGSDNHTVVFTPELGYYVDSVQWASFSGKLADETDIPASNVTIPELKDGSESTYKHVATMDSSVNNGYNYDPFGTTTFTYNDIDNNHYLKVISKEMKMVIQISKEDIETGKDTQGDAKFEGAQYTIYKTYNETTGAVSDAVEVVTLDADGNGDSSELALGTYYVKETLAPEGYLIDENVYTVTQTAEQQTADREKVSYHLVTSKEKVMKGSLEVVKSLHKDESTDSGIAEGCKLFLTLDSNPEKVYEATIDKYGYAKFEQIPYGWYTITESEEAIIAGYELMDPEPVYVRENNIRLYRIIEENPIRTYVKVVKKDAETGRVIPVANTKYKIWSYANNAYVTMMSYQEGLISVFTTGSKGEFKTPETLPIGKYKLVELTPPTGYQLQDMDFEIKGGVFENSAENPVVVVEQKDIAQKAKIKITKLGEVLVGVKQETDPDTGLEVITPVYEEKGLEGVKFTVTASEDIVTADGTIRMTKGESIEIVTDEEGIAQTEELYLGTYTLQETETLPGYKLNDTVETVVLDYRTNGVAEDGKTIVIPDYTVEYTYKNERIPYVLEFDKTFGNSEYNNVDRVYTEKVKFGLYAAKDIKGYASENVLIKADTLLEVISVENGKCKATVELPLGEYYIQELDIEGLPFEIDTTKYGFVFKPEATANVQVITINDGNSIDNPLIKGNMNFLKITRKVYEANLDLINEIVENNDEEAFNEFANEYGLEGAKYQVYFKDENGEYQKLQVKAQGSEEYEDVIFTTNNTGIDNKTLPYGTYYLKEIEAPDEHQVDPNYIEAKVSGAINISIVNDPKIQGKIVVRHVDIDTGDEIYPVENREDDLGEPYTTEDKEKEINDEYGAGFDIYEFVEEKLPENKDGVYEKEEQEVIYYYKRYTGSLLVIKKDAETAERLPGCIFTIKDKVTGKVLVENAETDENGEYYMEEVPYGLYVFTEVKAPEGYEIEEGSVGAEFAVSTDETIFEIVNTGDIAVVALVVIAVLCIGGIIFVVAKNKSSKK